MSEPTSPQSLFTIGNIVIASVFTSIAGLLGRMFFRNEAKTDDHDKRIVELEKITTEFVPSAELMDTYAKKSDLADVKLRIAELASRRELIAYGRLQKRETQIMHDANSTALKDLRDLSERRDTHAQEFRKEMRDAVHDIAIKLEAVATIQKVQGGA